jgi:hypothetical protein
MAFFAAGRVRSATHVRIGLVRAQVDIGDDVVEAVGFPSMLGEVSEGDEVVVNTTGLELALGTGGVGFLLWNKSREGPEDTEEGHIVKLRYTPWQLNVSSAEEQGSAHHDALRGVTSIEGMPVVGCGLHSQVAAVAAGVKAARPEARVVYLMSDAGALPLAWSELVAQLRAARLLDATCTHGHAFGGELEAVNIFSGLVALREIAGADVVVAGPGPGIVGTGTVLGFSSIEQGQNLDAAGAVGGRAVACLRLAFTDARARHRGVSHHTLTALSVAAQRRCIVAVPRLDHPRAEDVRAQLRAAGIEDRHDVREGDGAPALELLKQRGVRAWSMGRGIEEVPELWLAAGAAGSLAAELI